ncbi:threonine-phosphate decarboxylase CobD [Pseudaminobacter soli (ex Li et al. 2025)]|uniref:threonine-phosphate decarboxylase n=1 Tax=Pseudaminobacter soli (ex Li et al. 2025) TaxID=1295366 RepID=A0A2P7SMV2_9HYPH|nr:threonine-phosphate decarboxylase CobD [Mesorhizobium soli]PSJ63809.1 threonine-phosphate decarboxylase [Mesorhizobium soli]
MALVNGNSVDAVADHGGSLGRASALFPHAPLPWIDLSTGINPHSYPLFDLPATAFSRLPEPARARELAAVAAATYGAPSAANVAPAPGTQILLPRVASLVKPGRALVLGPTYAEHSRACVIAGHAVAEVRDFDALFGADIAVVVNPNNPNGCVVSRRDLLDLADKMRSKGGLLVVDEAFMEVGPQDERVDGDVERGGLVVLRSFGKFFGLAGVRLGFAIAAEPLAARLDAELGPWAVAGPTLEYGIKALGDEAWQQSMCNTLYEDAVRLDALFAGAGIQISGGTSLFRFVRIPDAAGLFAALGERGILIRNFGWDDTALRIGIPGREAEWQRLEQALAAWAAKRDARATEA